MNLELRGIQDWVERARKAGYGVHGFAKNCGCSVRRLERHFALHQCSTPEDWLTEIKLCDAARFLMGGQHIKEAAANAGFPCLCHFYRTFKAFYSLTPVQLLNLCAQSELEWTNRIVEALSFAE